MTKPLLRVLRGEALWPPPVWLMRQAGRYLPEYRTLRTKVSGFLELALIPDLATEVTLQPVRRFGFDAAILFSDILIIPWALGQALDYREGEGPVLPPIRSERDLRGLDLARLPEAAAPVYETIARVARQLRADHPNTALLGFAGSPFTVVSYMVEGGGSKDFAQVRGLAYREPAMFAKLIHMITEATITHLAAQVHAGAETVMLFDSWAGVLAPILFREHVIQPTRHIVAALTERFPSLKIIGFPRLAGLMLAEYVAQTGIAAVGVDTGADLTLACRIVPDSVALQGNLDPLALACGGTSLDTGVSDILGAMRGRPFIFNLGHGVVPETPPDHVVHLVELVRGG